MTAADNLSDNDLLRRMRAGDEAAFTALYRRRQAGVYRFALQMSGSPSLAEDITQEVFLALMRDRDGYDERRGALAAYLYGIARNLLLRRLARDRRFVPFDDAGGEEEEPSSATLASSGDPLGDLTRDETIAAVRAAVLALPPHYREVVVLCELHEMSYQDAAAALGCAVGTVRSRLHRARALLIEKLRGAEREDGARTQVRCLV